MYRIRQEGLGAYTVNCGDLQWNFETLGDAMGWISYLQA